MDRETKACIGYWFLFFLITCFVLFAGLVLWSSGLLIFAPLAIVVPLAMNEVGCRRFGKSKTNIILGNLIGSVFVCILLIPCGISLLPVICSFFLAYMVPILIISKWGGKGILPGTLLVWLIPLVVQMFPGGQNGTSYFIIFWLFLGWLPGLVYCGIIVLLRMFVNWAIKTILARREILTNKQLPKIEPQLATSLPSDMGGKSEDA